MVSEGISDVRSVHLRGFRVTRGRSLCHLFLIHIYSHRGASRCDNIYINISKCNQYSAPTHNDDDVDEQSPRSGCGFSTDIQTQRHTRTRRDTQTRTDTHRLFVSCRDVIVVVVVIVVTVVIVFAIFLLQ